MADPEKKPLKGDKAKGEEGKDDEPEEEQKGCCDKFAECIVAVCKAFYVVLMAFCNSIRSCLAFIWYPIKEQCNRCCENRRKSKQPYLDPNFEGLY